MPLNTPDVKVVFGRGDPDAEIVFVGESPAEGEEVFLCLFIISDIYRFLLLLIIHSFIFIIFSAYWVTLYGSRGKAARSDDSERVGSRCWKSLPLQYHQI